MWKRCWRGSKNRLRNDSNSNPNFLFLNCIYKSDTSLITYWGASEWNEYFQYFQSTFKVHFSFLSFSPSLWKGKVCVHTEWRCPRGLVCSIEDHWGYNTVIDSCFLIAVSLLAVKQSMWMGLKYIFRQNCWFQLLFSCLSPIFNSVVIGELVNCDWTACHFFQRVLHCAVHCYTCSAF